MPRPALVSHTAPIYPDVPQLAWTTQLDTLMWVDRFDVLYPAGYLSKPRPLGVDFDGILKVDIEGLDERAQRARCLEVFEHLLDVLAEAGVLHREHPRFEIGGQVSHGAVFLNSIQATPDRLTPQCAVQFRVWLEGA